MLGWLDSSLVMKFSCDICEFVFNDRWVIVIVKLLVLLLNLVSSMLCLLMWLGRV